MVMNVGITVFRYVMPCVVVDVYRSFGLLCWMKEALVTINQTSRRQMPEDGVLIFGQVLYGAPESLRAGDGMVS
jgi:hypothetical protein